MIKKILRIIYLPFMYLGIQTVVLIIGELIFILPDVFRESFEAAAGGKTLNPEYFSDELMGLLLEITLPLLIVSCVVSFVIIFLIFRKEWKTENFFGLKNIKIPPLVLCVFLGAALNILTISILTLLPVSQEPSVLDNIIGSNLIIDLLAVAVFGPFIEEIIFRGIIQKYLTKMIKLPAAIILQATIFGVVHFNIIQSSYAFVLGIVLGLIYLRFHSIWSVIIVHVVYNATSVLLFYIPGGSEIDLLYFLVISAAVTVISAAGLAYSAKKKRESNRWEY